MESREAKVVMVGLNQLASMIIDEAKKKPGEILPDPVPKVEGANFSIEQNQLKCVFTFASKKPGTVVVIQGGGGDSPDA